MAESTNPLVLLSPLGLKPLNKTWAKIEIFLGLAGVFLGLVWGVALCARTGELPSPNLPDFQFFIAALVLFVLSGYLTLAGHRSHLYQSNNQLIAFVVQEIRRNADKESIS